jgi:hypothetical protein
LIISIAYIIVFSFTVASSGYDYHKVIYKPEHIDSNLKAGVLVLNIIILIAQIVLFAGLALQKFNRQLFCLKISSRLTNVILFLSNALIQIFYGISLFSSN